jgi:hypothetical protein
MEFFQFKKINRAITTFILLALIANPLSAFAQETVDTSGITLPSESTEPLPTEREGTIRDLNTGQDVSVETAKADSKKAQATVSSGKADYDDKGICTMSFTGSFKLTQCIGWMMFATGAWFVGKAGTFLNFAISISIVKMKSIIEGVGAVNVAWKVLRDLANVFFIFILIYIAIMTILGLAGGETRRMLTNVILVALFINFSLFFTKVIVDASNILTIQFYNSISRGPDDAKNGLSYVFMEGSRLKTLISTPQKPESTIAKETPYMFLGFMSLLFGIILGFAFLAIGILFVIRLVMIIFLMILSPIAFLGITVPKLNDVWNKWWGTLINQSLFAPTMMLMLWVIAAVINSPGYVAALQLNNQTVSFVQLVDGSAGGRGVSSLILVNFAILIVMLIGGVMIANSFGTWGSGAVTSTFDKWSRRAVGASTLGAVGFAGRNTIGRLGSKLAGTEFMKRQAARSTLGALTLKGMRGVANSNFDARGVMGDALGEAQGKGGYQAKLDKQVKERVEFAKSLGKDVKIQDKETKAVIKKHEDTKEKAQGRLDEIDAQIAKQTKLNTPEAKAQIKLLEAERYKAMKERDDASGEIGKINKNPLLTKTAEQVYGKRLETEKGVVAGAQTLWTKITRKDKEAAEKIEENYKKEKEKQEKEWKKKYDKTEKENRKKELESKEREDRAEEARLNEEIKKLKEEANRGGPNVNIIELNRKQKEHSDKLREIADRRVARKADLEKINKEISEAKKETDKEDIIAQAIAASGGGGSEKPKEDSGGH